MTDRAVMIGLDGAAWHLLDPLIEQGAMPRLAALKKEGAAGTLKSTVPTYTPPAWTSAWRPGTCTSASSGTRTP